MASPTPPEYALPAAGWQRALHAVAEALFESDTGPAQPRRVRWVLDDIDHFLMTVGGKSQLVIRASIEVVGRLGPLAVGSLAPFHTLSLERRRLALRRIERSPAGLTIFALKTLLSLHWFEHPDTISELDLGHRGMK